MDYTKLEHYVSKPRLDRYLISCSNSQARAINLSAENIKVSQAFYPLMNLFETFLRNKINDNLTTHFSDGAWIINQKTGFMSDPSLGPKYRMKKCVIDAEFNIRGTITPGKIVAEQSLGFWTSLFEPSHYSLISGSVLGCFPNKPTTANRNTISSYLKRIREFRNRIYHNEAICFNNITIDFTHVSAIKSDIYTLLDWMDADLKPYVQQFDNISAAIVQAQAV